MTSKLFEIIISWFNIYLLLISIQSSHNSWNFIKNIKKNIKKEFYNSRKNESSNIDSINIGTNEYGLNEHQNSENQSVECDLNDHLTNEHQSNEHQSNEYLVNEHQSNEYLVNEANLSFIDSDNSVHYQLNNEFNKISTSNQPSYIESNKFANLIEPNCNKINNKPSNIIQPDPCEFNTHLTQANAGQLKTE